MKRLFVIMMAVFFAGVMAASAAEPSENTVATPTAASSKGSTLPVRGGTDAGSVLIPYRLTDTKHVLVRAKLNGQGPFNFILDTGAPAVFIPKAVAKKVGIETDEKGWGTFKSFELEGGLVVQKARTRVEDLFQLEGMNGMGLAGVELHGVIGYNVLARYRITFDFTADKLTFAPLQFDPPPPQGLGKGGEGQGGLEIMGTMMKVMAGLMGVKPDFDIRSSGSVGVEFDQKSAGLFVKRVFKDGPADVAGLQVGDKIDSVVLPPENPKGTSRTVSIDDVADFNRSLKKSLAGSAIKVVVEREGKSKSVSVTLGKGY